MSDADNDKTTTARGPMETVIAAVHAGVHVNAYCHSCATKAGVETQILINEEAVESAVDAYARALLADAVAALEEIWDTVPSSSEPDDPMVQRHASALNSIPAVLARIAAARSTTEDA